MNDTLLMIFIGVSSLAIVLQAGMMIAMYATTKKTSARLEALADEVRTKALPAVESVHTLIVDNKGRVEEILANLSDASGTARSQLLRVDATIGDIVDRARLQVMRVDELTTSTLDKVEETAAILQHSVVGPVRRINGVISGLSAGLGIFVGARRVRKNVSGSAAGQEDMFI